MLSGADAQWALASPRVWEPLVLRGPELSALRNIRVDRLEVMALHDGKLAPIPFQVDAVMPDRSFAMSQGPQPTVRHQPLTVGPNDEMVMMMFDLSERVAAAQLPPDALEVAVKDLLGGPDRYAYIAVVNNPRLSPARYVDYDPKEEQIETEHYRLGFAREFPDDLRLQNHRGEQSRNLIDGFELRGSVALLGMVHFKLSERDIESRLLAYRAGPVRVIRRLGHRIRVFLGIHSPQVSTVEFFYRDFAQAPFTMRFPLHALFRDIQGRIAMDFIDLRGFSLLASGLDGPIQIGPGTAERQLDQWDDAPPADWVALRGDGRLMLQAFAPSPELAPIKRRLYYRGAPAAADGSAPSGAVVAAVGIQTKGWEKLRGGSHRFDPLLISVPENYGATRVINESTVPPFATVRPVSETIAMPPADRSPATPAPPAGHGK
jgi:hypothetical protein